MSTEVATPPTGSPRNHSIWRPRNLLIALVACALVNFGLSLIVREISMNNVTPSAVKYCAAKGAEGVSVSDNGRRILIDTQESPGDSGAPDQMVDCLIEQLHIPVQVISDINNTNHEQGKRSATWDGFKAEWTFDSQVGHQITVERS